MKAFALVSCCLIALVSARPEPPVGYQYNRPISGGNVLFNGGGGGLGGLGVLGAGSSNIGIGVWILLQLIFENKSIYKKYSKRFKFKIKKQIL